MADRLATEAEAALGSGNLALAEALAQDILRREPDNRWAAALMEHLAALIGLAPAGSGEIRFGAVENTRINDYLAGCGPCDGERKFLLIKAWGAGFWADVFHVLGALLLAEVTGRVPHVHWGANSNFSPGGDANANAFALYFQPVNPDAWEAIQAVRPGDIFPAKWGAAGVLAEDIGKLDPLHGGGEGKMAAFYLLNRPEPLVVSDYHIGVVDVLPWLPAAHPWSGLALDEVVRALMAKYLAPQDDISARIEAVAASRLAGGKFLGVHVRGSDKVVELANLAEANAAYEPTVEAALAHGYNIFLMTDSVPIERDYRDRYPGRVVCLDALRSAGNRGTHHMAAGAERYRAGSEVLVDVMAAARCDRFLGNGRSNPSCMVDFLFENPEHTQLVIPNQNRRRFINMYRDG